MSRAILIAASIISVLLGTVFWANTPVKAQVFSMEFPLPPDIPLNPFPVPDFQIIGSYETHLANFTFSVFFPTDDGDLFYVFEVGSADVVYSGWMDEEYNISIKYDLSYEDLRINLSSDSFLLNFETAYISSSGNLEISLLGDGDMSVVAYEMIPRYALIASRWSEG